MANVYLQIEELTKSYGIRMLFSDVTFGVNEGDKIGIVAKNGTGKSTLLNIIAGNEAPDSGKVAFRADLKVGYLPQLLEFNPDDTVLEACLTPGIAATDAILEYEEALKVGETSRLNEAIHNMDVAHAWDYEDRVKQMLTQLKITDLSARMSTLSGGQSKRVGLARLLLTDPQLLILDEPTNHLDIDVIEWIEGYLKRSRVTLLMVTHDRYFLDRVCNKIIEIDHESIFTYDGNYDYYLRRRRERIEALNEELAKVKNTLRRETEWMRRQPQARAGKARYRINQFYDLSERAKANYDDKNVTLNVKSSYIGSKIFEAEGISKRFGEKVILDNFTYTFSRYEKLGIIGANGVGKSTFIKLLQGIIQPDTGEWNIGETVRFGYYSQDGINFNESEKVIDAVTRKMEEVVVNGGVHYSPMQFLQKFLFTPADQQKYISTLSGGEKARLHLATVLMSSPNFLILDEPTNDLDIPTLGLLEEYLSTFEGCVIVISHDRFFLDSIVDHLFVMQGNGVIKDFPGSYTEYRDYLSQQEIVSSQSQQKTIGENRQQRRHEDRSNKMTFKERKEYEALTVEIEQLNNDISELDALFASGEVLENVAETSARYSSLKERLDEAELRWLELSEKE